MSNSSRTELTGLSSALGDGRTMHPNVVQSALAAGLPQALPVAAAQSPTMHPLQASDLVACRHGARKHQAGAEHLVPDDIPCCNARCSHRTVSDFSVRSPIRTLQSYRNRNPCVNCVRSLANSLSREHDVLCYGQRSPPDDKSAKGALSCNGVVRGVILSERHRVQDAWLV